MMELTSGRGTKINKKIISLIFVIIMSFSLAMPTYAQQLPNLPVGVGVRDFGRYSYKDTRDSTKFYYILLNNNEMWSYKTATESDSYKPVKILDNVKSVHPSSGYNVFVIRTDGSLWGWGANEDYELGIGNNNPIEKPVKIMDDVKEVYPAQYYNTYVIKTDNTLWGWGGNWFGQLGDGTTDTSPKPKKIYEDVKKADAGNNILYFLTNDNQVYVIGDVYGASTPGLILGGVERNMVYKPELILEDVKDINYKVFIKNDGSVWGYTSGSSSYIGFYKSPTKLTNFDFKVKDFWEVVFSYYFLKEDNSLWVYGSVSNLDGIAVDKTTDIKDPIKLLDDVKYFDAYERFAVKSNGELWAWGNGHSSINVNHEVKVLKVPTKLADGIDTIYVEHGKYFNIKSVGSLCELGVYEVDKNYNYVKRVNYVNHIQLVEPIKATGMKDETKHTSNNNEIKVTYKGKELNFAMPIINRNDRTFYPMRELLESLGAKVSWDNTTSMVTGELNGKKVEFVIGSNTYKANGSSKIMDADITAFMEGGRTYIPIRHACEGLGLMVEWDGATNTIIIK